MTDERVEKLAKNIVNYSCKVQQNERVLINAVGQCDELVKALIKQVYLAKAQPFVVVENQKTKRELLMGITKEQAKIMAKHECEFMSQMQAYIGIREQSNSSELVDVPQENLRIYNKYYSSPLNKIRVPKTKWVVLNYPSGSLAQKAKTSTEAFEDFYFKVCTLDYQKMENAMTPLVELVLKTDQVKIVGPGKTNLNFSIKNIGAVKCHGIRNVPDGEVYTAPVKTSINGILEYNTSSYNNGVLFPNIVFEFKDGKVVDANSTTPEKTKLLNTVLDIDEGARYIGEFAFGVNPHIIEPIGDTLFDEKIAGSFHFTPGQCYAKAPNGNDSALHWDLICIQTKKYGGGEIYFDGVLIRKDGLFVVEELLGLNPKNLA